MKYSAVRPNLQTGDIVLFSGKGGISEGIKWVTSCKWSHVGLVLVSKDWDMALLWESTTLSTLKDLETQTKRQGVQLVPLSARIETYTGDASIRHIRKPLVAKQKKALQKFRKAMKGRKYEKSKLELINSAYDGIWGDNTEDLSSLFCSELVAEAFQKMGLLSEDLPSNEYTPKDFSTAAEAVLETHGKEIVVT